MKDADLQLSTPGLVHNTPQPLKLTLQTALVIDNMQHLLKMCC
jgi:hypothetical protein